MTRPWKLGGILRSPPFPSRMVGSSGTSWPINSMWCVCMHECTDERRGNGRHNGLSHTDRHGDESPNYQTALILRICHQHEVLIILHSHSPSASAPAGSLLELNKQKEPKIRFLQ